MTMAQWNQLRPGDIVIERRSKTPRIVLTASPKVLKAGPREGQTHSIIRLRMLHGSWRSKCTITTLIPSDVLGRLDVAWGRRARVTRMMRTCCRKHGVMS